MPFKDTTLNAIVLGPSFGVPGTIVTPATVTISGSNTLVTATGNYSAGKAAIGRKYTSQVSLPVKYQRDGNGDSLLGTNLTSRVVRLTVQDTGYVKLRREMPSRTDANKEFNVLGGNIIIRSQLEALLNFSVGDTTLWIESDSPKPFNVGGIELLCDTVDKGM